MPNNVKNLPRPPARQELRLSLDPAVMDLIKQTLTAGFKTNAAQLTRMEKNLMSKIADTHKSVKEGFDASNVNLDNLAADVAALDAKITQMQNTPGPISPEDQALLDEMQEMSQSLKARTRAMADVHPEESEPEPTV